MPKPTPANQIPTVEDTTIVSADDDFSLRCLIEDMHRRGADERSIVRAVNAAVGRQAQPRRRGGLRRELQRLTRRG